MNVDDLLNPYFWVEVLVEFILCAFVLTAVIWALTTLNEHAFKPTTTHFGIFAGFISIALIEGYGPLCGTLLNPAGVWGFFVAGRISLVRAILYMAAEIAGAATGGMIGTSLTPDPQAQVPKTIIPGPGITIGMGMAIEGIVTFNLMVVALSCTNQKTKTSVMPSVPVAFCVAASIMAAGTHTGGLGNPIVTFGAAVPFKTFTMLFPIYWAGPYIGATVGAVFYTMVITAKKYLERHQVSLQPEEEDDAPEKNGKSEVCYPDDGKSEMCYPDDGKRAIHLQSHI